MNAKRRNSIDSVINELIEKFEEIKAEAIDQLSEIRDEEQDAYDNLPESLQESERGENMQNCIDAWRKRLCRMATPEARELAEDFKMTLHETHPLESDVLVPNCIYRMGCPEFKTCGYMQNFIRWVEENYPGMDWMADIQTRYDLYNDYFYRSMSKREV